MWQTDRTMQPADAAAAGGPRPGFRATRQQRQRSAPRGRGRRRLLVGSFVSIALLTTTAYVLDLLTRTDGDAFEQFHPATAPAVPATPAAPGTPVPQSSPLAPTDFAPVLWLPGEFPDRGPGNFRFAGRPGEVLGEDGPVRRFRLAVEDNLDDELAEFTVFVDDTLSADRGWTAGGQWRFQRVPDEAGHDFTILLATAGTTERLCAAGGLQVAAAGLPEGGVSCRLSGQVIINLHRWRMSVPHYVDEQVPLAVYRQMVINHEVGHELGYGHEACPARGEPAPVMQQQTISLAGCEANPWPFLDGELHRGPPTF
jgi:hypothetical protein